MQRCTVESTATGANRPAITIQTDAARHGWVKLVRCSHSVASSQFAGGVVASDVIERATPEVPVSCLDSGSGQASTATVAAFETTLASIITIPNNVMRFGSMPIGSTHGVGVSENRDLFLIGPGEQLDWTTLNAGTLRCDITVLDLFEERLPDGNAVPPLFYGPIANLGTSTLKPAARLTAPPNRAFRLLGWWLWTGDASPHEVYFGVSENGLLNDAGFGGCEGEQVGSRTNPSQAISTSCEFDTDSDVASLLQKLGTVTNVLGETIVLDRPLDLAPGFVLEVATNDSGSYSLFAPWLVEDVTP